MPVLLLEQVPTELYEQLQRLAADRNQPIESAAIDILHDRLCPGLASRTQADVLAEMQRRRFTPRPGTPDSVELLREDRER